MTFEIADDNLLKKNLIIHFTDLTKIDFYRGIKMIFVSILK